MSNEKAVESTNRTRQPNRRRRKFVRKDLQLKIIFGTLFVALIVLVINFQLPIMGMWIMRATSSIWLDTHYNIMIKLLVTSFATSFLLTIPLAIWMGIVFSFQFVGPIYKIKKFFVELNSGRWDKICRLRKRDDLKDVAEVINQYVGLARDRLRSQHETLEKVRAYLESRESSDQVDALLALIRAEDAEYQPRLGAIEVPADPDAASAQDARSEETETEEAARAREAASGEQETTTAAGGGVREVAADGASDADEPSTDDVDRQDQDDVTDEDRESDTEREPVMA